MIPPRLAVGGLPKGPVGGTILSRLKDSYLDSLLSVAEVSTESAARNAVDRGGADAALVIPHGLTRAARAAENVDSAASPVSVTVYHRNSAGPAPGIVRTIVATVLDSYIGRDVAVRTARAQDYPDWSDAVRDSVFNFYLNWLASPRPMFLGRSAEPARGVAPVPLSASLKVGILDLDAEGNSLSPAFADQVINVLRSSTLVEPFRLPVRDSNRLAAKVSQGRLALVLNIPRGYGDSLVNNRPIRPLNALLAPGPAGQWAAAAVNQSLRRVFSARFIAQLCARRRVFDSELERRAFVNRVAAQALDNWQQSAISIRDETPRSR